MRGDSNPLAHFLIERAGGRLHKDDNSTRQGFALVLVLWVVAVMGVFTMLITSQTRLSLKMNHNAQEGLRAKLLAEAGIHRFVAELREDAELTLSDHQNETWFHNQSLFFDVPLGDGIYRLSHIGLDKERGQYFGGVDECSKLNLNTATRGMLLQLPNATEEVGDAILDWRDEDDDPREFGAEVEYYQSQPEPHRPKNGFFDTVEEVLLVKGMTLPLLYGEDTNRSGTLEPSENDGNLTPPGDNQDGVLDRGWWPYVTVYSYEKNESADGQARINVNDAEQEELEEAFGDVLSGQEIQSIIQQRENEEFETIAHVLDTDIDQEKWRQIADRITVSEDETLQGRINLNTASRTVLRTVFPENEAVVEGIVEYRESNEAPFEHLGQLLDVEGVNEDLLKSTINHLGTKSSVFSAVSIGYLERSKAYKKIYAAIDRGADTPQIIFWEEMR